jgi:hypothetical protein
MKTTIIAGALIAALLVAGCSGKDDKTGANGEKPLLTQGSPGPHNAVAGVAWSLPARWKVTGERPMRIATYAIPSGAAASTGGETAEAECAVFHFGSGQGGDVRANIDRWVGQFENPSTPVEGEKEVDGMKVITVTTTGTYLAPSGPMMQSQGKLANYMLLGAIVEGPGGSVFFKLTGPSATVEGAKAEFDALLGSIRKQ